MATPTQNTVDQITDTQPPGTQFSTGYSYYVLTILFLVYVFNFIDRQILSVFIGPIREEFGVSDTAMGLLVGFAFTLLYTIAGIPIARWADRSNRRTIIAIGLAIWSAMTAASGMAKTFVHLVLARIGVGIGEAAGSPPAHSLISDYFPPSRRATALAIYGAGAFAGSAIAYLGGGYLREFFDWRTAFIVLGLPGILLALVVRFTVKEPPRGYSEQRTDTETSTLGETLRFLLGSKSWLYLIVGSSLISITAYSILMWGFEFYGRVHGMSPSAIGQWMALIVGGGGCLGSILGGRLTDSNVSRPSRMVSVPGLVTLGSLPLGLTFLMVDSSLLSLLSFLVFYTLFTVFQPTMFATTQTLARLRMRATASAILLFIINITGAGFGPLLVGALSDAFVPFAGEGSIRYSLICVMSLSIVGALCFVISGRYLEADLRRTIGAT